MENHRNLEDIIEIFSKEGKPRDFTSFLEEIEKDDLTISFEDLYDFNSEISNEHRVFITPSVLKKFITSYLKNKEFIQILDPWCHFGEILESLSMNAEHLTGINPNSTEIAIAKKLLVHEKFQLLHGDTIKILDAENKVFDLVVSTPPFKYKSTSISYDGIIISDYGSNIIIKSLLKLKENGIGLFVVSSNFFNNSNKLVKILEKTSFFIDAAFHIPPGTLPNTSISSYLIVIGRKKYEEIFIAQLNMEANFETILTNWKKRVSGKILSLGHLTKFNTFQTYEKIEIDLEIDKFVRKSNLETIGLNELALKINQFKIDSAFKETINSIYIPQYGLSNVLSDLDDIKNKPSNYIEVVLDPKKVSNVYMANWFNSQLGVLVRKSFMNGGTPQRVMTNSLLSTNLYIPPKERVQENAVKIQARIDSLRTELKSLEGRLWENPNLHDNISRSLRSLNRDEGMEQWIERLPFPLASILWKYHATKNQKDKKELLLYFFEALAQFSTVLLLSAYNNDDELLNKENSDLNIDKIIYSTFGSWINIGEQLAKKTRRLMSDKNDKVRCLRMFKHKRSNLIDVFTDKKIYHVLNRTKQYRNDWKGHGGIEGMRETPKRLELLQSELIKIRDIIGDVFEDYTFIKPGEGHFEDGLYKCKCSQIMGTRSTFKERLVKVSMGLDVRELYLIENENFEALKFLPFIKLMSSPATEENACYFYNRIDGDSVRMVSYYFEKEADINIQEDNIQKFIRDFDKG
ncbi:type I restriction-modification system DNA methylase subunit [Sinobaca qinghaiensis]|uniref:Type I restriction-modification system DNA methylase subunit n=1 Tax=Sinobaca qinghaiensis TaxID=342944 RepID=A0A419V0C5_9BACL|nr:N-6 DNA methylase [Sinobaca qinghaiensis]RKD71371.1 type I restriction-modification system DNA methylase subunit [Sinobaca qinghaiensis]